jgi:hypothetical protein
MRKVVCINESVYHGSLTYGSVYDIVGVAADKGHVRVRDDRGRLRWYPAYLFTATADAPPRMNSFTIDDEIEESPNVEVTIEFTDGSRRWCFFITPETLAVDGDSIEGTHARMHYGSNMIVVSELSADTIERALRQIERQGDLWRSTVPLGNSSAGGGEDPAEQPEAHGD